MPLIDDCNPRKKYTLLLAHGAGASAQSEFMQQIKTLLEQQSIQVVRLNFPYMEKSIQDGKRRPPDRMPKLLTEFHSLIKQLNCNALWLGGKSMGGRVATMSTELPEVKGSIALGYPFHPPGKPDNLRTEHLKTMSKPCFIVQGERDPFGKKEEVESYHLSTNVELSWIPDGDHSLKPRKKSGHTEEENLQLAAKQIASFIKSH